MTPWIALTLWTPTIVWASTCNKLIELAELKQLIKQQNQTIVAQSQLILDQRATIDTFTSTRVMFMVALTADKTYNQETTVLWDKVLSNVGGGYAPDTGKFTAPVAGDYFFTTAIYSCCDKSGMELIVNGVFQMGGRTGSSTGGTATAATVARLAKGDTVHVYYPSWAEGQLNLWHSYFMGHLIRMEL